MRIFNPTIIPGCLILLCLASCTRELRPGGDKPIQPFSFNQIPSPQLSAGESTTDLQTSAGITDVPTSVLSKEIIPDDSPSPNAEVQALMDDGRAALKQNNINLAIEKFQKVIDIEPKNVKALYNLGLAYRMIGNKGKAVEYSLKAVEADPNQPYVHQNLGFAYEDSGEIEKAMLEFEEELKRWPEDKNLAEIAAKLAVLRIERGLLEEAFDAANHAIKLQPDKPSNYAILARVHLKNKAYDQAIEALQKAVDLAKDSGDYRKLLADALWEANRKEEAKKVYSEAIALNSDLVKTIDKERLP